MTASPEDIAAQISAGQPLTPASGVCGGDGQMSCEEASELIQLYLDRAIGAIGAISAAGSAGSAVAGREDVEVLVTEHLGLCAPCESEFAVYQRISIALSRCRQDVPDGTRERLEQFCSDLCSGGSDADA